MRNKLKKIVGTLLTFALAFTMIGGDTKNVNAAPSIPNTSLRVQWSEGMAVRGIGTTNTVGYLLLDKNWVDSQSADIKEAFGALYQFSDTANGMTVDYAQMVMDATNLENEDVYLLPLVKPGPGTSHATAPDAGADIGPNVKGVLLAVVQGTEPGWYFNYYDRSVGAMEIGEEGTGGKGTIVIRLGVPREEIKESPEIEEITISGEKTWIGNGIKPDSITVKLLRNDVEIGNKIVTAAGGVWTYDFGVHPVTDEAGNEYDYEIEEVLVDGFTTTYDGFDIINTTNVVIVPEIKGAIEFLKHDDKGSVLEGAEFELYAADDTSFEHVIDTATSDANGVVRFEDVEEGSYKIKESAAPAGYIKSDVVLNATIAVDEETVAPVGTPVVNTAIKGTIQITKVDMEDNEIVLQGATFKIVDKVGTEVFEGTTNALGKLEIELPYGEYTLSEVTAPTGYEKITGTQLVSITEKDQIVELEIQNEKIEDEEVDPLPVEDKVGTLRITKVDKDDHEILLKGAKFKLVDKDGETVFEGITDEDGKLETELLVGKYTLSEVTAPKDYEKTTETWTVNIEEDETFALVIENEMIEVEEVDPLPIDDEVGTVRIKKVDKETDEVLAGVKFRITDKDGDVVFEGMTDDKGMIEEELLVGEYTITEVEALPGYVPSTKSEVVRIEEDGEVLNLTITNKKMYGLVSIKKVDAESGEVLEGAKFKIVDKAGVVILEDYTDEDGMLEVWLPKGEYIISETEAPEDYDKTDETWSVKVTADGQLFELKVENTMIEVEVVSPVTLPQTGGIPSEFLYILGAFAIFTGMLLTKKRQGV